MIWYNIKPLFLASMYNHLDPFRVLVNLPIALKFFIQSFFYMSSLFETLRQKAPIASAICLCAFTNNPSNIMPLYLFFFPLIMPMYWDWSDDGQHNCPTHWINGLQSTSFACILHNCFENSCMFLWYSTSHLVLCTSAYRYCAGKLYCHCCLLL